MKKRLKQIIAMGLTTAVFLGVMPNINVNAVMKESNKLAAGDKERNTDAEKRRDKITKDVKDINLNKLGKERVLSSNKGKLPKSIKVSPLGEEVISRENNFLNPVGVDMLPASIDNSKLEYFPEVKTQGSIGSCASWSTTYYNMTYMTAFANGWNVKDSNGKNIDSRVFSPKFTYNMVNGGFDGGSYDTDSYYILQQHGGVTWDKFPYETNGSISKNYREWCTDKDAWREAGKYKIDQIYDVPFADDYYAKTFITSEKDPELDLIKKALNNGYILNFSTYIYDYKTQPILQNPKSSLDDEYLGDSAITEMNPDGRHSMTIVGYNDDLWVDINNNSKQDPGEFGAFKVANSWGPNFENNGFVWFTYDSFNEVSAVEGKVSRPGRVRSVRYNEASYITTKKSETPKLMAQFTLSHGSRSDIEVILGASSSSFNMPVAEKRFNHILTNAGGAYSFDGDEIKDEATFTLDFGTLYNGALGDRSKFTNWYVTFKDSYSNGKPLSIKDVKLVDGNGNVLNTSKVKTTKEIEGGEITYKIDYDFNEVTPWLQTPEIEALEAENIDGNNRVQITIPKHNTATLYRVYENGNNIALGTMRENLAYDKVEEINRPYMKPGVYEYKVIIFDKDGKSTSSNTVTITVKASNIEPWKSWTNYKVGDKVIYANRTFMCRAAHLSLDDWNPVDVPALWEEIK